VGSKRLPLTLFFDSSLKTCKKKYMIEDPRDDLRVDPRRDAERAEKG
jgi:hypothetical protein